MTLNIRGARNLSRLALPEDNSYLFRIGVAVYGFASLNSFLCEIIAHLDPSQNHTALQDKHSSDILDKFNKTSRNLMKLKQYPEIHTALQEVSHDFKYLMDARNDIMHSYPITSPTGAQILHRRKDKSGKYFEVTNVFLNDFIMKFNKMSGNLHKIRFAVEEKKK